MAEDIISKRPQDKYWANVHKDDLPHQVEGRKDEYFDSLEEMGRWDLYRRSARVYYGQDAEGKWKNSASVTYTGVQGEIVNIQVNDFRALVNHRMVLITGQALAFQGRAVNTDVRSYMETQLAEDLIDYYMTERRVEDVTTQTAEYATVLSEGWTSVTWDTEMGADYAIAQTASGAERVLKEGDIRVESHAPWDVIRDLYRDPDRGMDWVILRREVNRWDLIAKYCPEGEEPQEPDKAAFQPAAAVDGPYREPGEEGGGEQGAEQAYEQAMEQWREAKGEWEKADDCRKYLMGFERPVDQREMLWLWWSNRRHSDTIPVFELYHAKTPALPMGRHAVIVGDRCLLDVPLPYEDIPIYPDIPAVEFGTGTGYASAWDLLALSAAQDSVYSTALSNHDALGLKNVLVAEGSNLNVKQMSGGLRMLKWTPIGIPNSEPKILDLPPVDKYGLALGETFGSIMERLFGTPKLMRGGQDSAESGAALALRQAVAVQFAAADQRAYTRHCEQVGTAIIRRLQKFAKTKRIAEVGGKKRRAHAKEFTGQDISNVRRVTIELGSPELRTAAGKRQAAKELLDAGVVQDPAQYYEAIEHGRIDPITQRETTQRLLIQAEGEALADGKPVKTLKTDLHHAHIQEHLCVLDDPEVRADDGLAMGVLQHVKEHVIEAQRIWIEEPALAELTGQMPLQALQAMVGPLPGEGPPPEGPPPANDNGDAGAARAEVPGAEGAVPEQEMPLMPVNPATGERTEVGDAPPMAAGGM